MNRNGGTVLEEKKPFPAEEDLFGKCPYVTAQKVLSGKWSLLILHHLEGEVLRFGELQRRLPELTQATLTRDTVWWSGRSTPRCRPGWNTP